MIPSPNVPEDWGDLTGTAIRFLLSNFCPDDGEFGADDKQTLPPCLRRNSQPKKQRHRLIEAQQIPIVKPTDPRSNFDFWDVGLP
jgi:hypothetical protein